MLGKKKHLFKCSIDDCMPWPITEFPPAPFLITSKKGSPNKGILGVIMKSHVMDMKFHPLNFMLMKSVNK
jgi:hypothetical protein